MTLWISLLFYQFYAPTSVCIFTSQIYGWCSFTSGEWIQCWTFIISYGASTGCSGETWGYTEVGSVVGKWRVRSLRAEYLCSLMFCDGCNADKIEATTLWVSYCHLHSDLCIEVWRIFTHVKLKSFMDWNFGMNKLRSGNGALATDKKNFLGREPQCFKVLMERHWCSWPSALDDNWFLL